MLTNIPTTTTDCIVKLIRGQSSGIVEIKRGHTWKETTAIEMTDNMMRESAFLLLAIPE
jgi:hypothetical protein